MASIQLKWLLPLLAASFVSGCDKSGATPRVERQFSDELALTPDRSLADIAGVPPDPLWAVGDGLFRRDGTAWREVSFPTRPRELVAVATVGRQVWAIGKSGTVAHFDERIWKLERVGGEGHTARLVDVLAWPGSVWAIDEGGEIWRREGESWKGSKPAELAGKKLGAAWGTGPERVFVAAETGVADWDGKRWKLTPLAGDVAIRAVHGCADDEVWAAGESARSIGKGPALFRFDGNAWKRVELPAEVGLSSVYARSRSEVYVAGERGTLLAYDGKQWQKVDGLPAGNLSAVFAPASGPLLVAIEKRRIARAH